MTSQPTPPANSAPPLVPSRATDASAAKPRAAKPWWLRIAGAPEFGLIVVIAAIVIGLRIATPEISRRDVTTLPAATVVEDLSSPEGAFRLTQPGKPAVTYLETDGYTYKRVPDGILVSRAYTANKFLNADNILSLLTAASFIAVMAVGMTGIIVKGGIDLSVGAIYALAAVSGAMVLHQLGGDGTPMTGPVATVLLGVGTCVGVGFLCGAVNGLATVGLKVHPFIITLGGMAVYRGIAFVTTKGQSISGFPESFGSGFFRAEIFGVQPVPMLVMIVVGLIGWFVLTRTVFGRHTFAIGGNEIAAKYAGIPVGFTKIKLFVICGGLAGLSAAMLLGYYGAGASNAGQGYELSVIAAAVVGGASLSGGRGSALGAVLGAVVIQLIDNSILMLDIDQNYKEIVIGLAIVIAVVVDQAKNRLAAGGRK